MSLRGGPPSVIEIILKSPPAVRKRGNLRRKAQAGCLRLMQHRHTRKKSKILSLAQETAPGEAASHVHYLLCPGAPPPPCPGLPVAPPPPGAFPGPDPPTFPAVIPKPPPCEGFPAGFRPAPLLLLVLPLLLTPLLLPPWPRMKGAGFTERARRSQTFTLPGVITLQQTSLFAGVITLQLALRPCASAEVGDRHASAPIARSKALTLLMTPSF